MKLVRTILSLIGLAAVAVVVLWLWVLSRPNPLTAPTAATLPWPAVCSTRGCITTKQWASYHVLRVRFASAEEQTLPTPADTLTTLTRQHLAHYAVVSHTLSLADVRRYREEVLNLRDEEQLSPVLKDVTLDHYDNAVLLPFLEQESLRAQRHAETPEDLYQQLAQERFVAVLPFYLRWNKEEGKVE